MITINLLPEEMKKREGTPLRRVALTLGGALLTTSVVGFYAYAEFGLLHGARSEKEQVQSILTSLASAAQYSDGLASEKRDYDRRVDTIQKIGNSRILWSKKLDQFFDIVDNDGDRDSHYIWLKNLTARSGSANARDKSGGELSINGYSATSKLQKLSKFHEDIKNHEFFDDFYHIDNPSGQVVEWDDDRDPSSAWEFSFNMKLQGQEEGQEVAPKQEKKTAANPTSIPAGEQK